MRLGVRYPLYIKVESPGEQCHMYGWSSEDKSGLEVQIWEQSAHR